MPDNPSASGDQSSATEPESSSDDRLDKIDERLTRLEDKKLEISQEQYNILEAWLKKLEESASDRLATAISEATAPLREEVEKLQRQLAAAIARLDTLDPPTYLPLDDDLIVKAEGVLRFAPAEADARGRYEFAFVHLQGDDSLSAYTDETKTEAILSAMVTVAVDNLRRERLFAKLSVTDQMSTATEEASEIVNAVDPTVDLQSPHKPEWFVDAIALGLKD